MVVETLIGIALFGLIIACAGLFSMWGFAVEREHDLREQNRKLKSLAKGLEDDRDDFRERFLDLDPAFRQLEDYAEKTDAEVAKLKDELEECKLGKLQVEKTCDILEEQAIRFAKSNAELGETILVQKERIEELLASLRVIHVRSMDVMIADAKQYPEDEPSCDDFDDDPADDIEGDSVSLDSDQVC